jgi:hypothetical protein
MKTARGILSKIDIQFSILDNLLFLANTKINNDLHISSLNTKRMKTVNVSYQHKIVLQLHKNCFFCYSRR